MTVISSYTAPASSQSVFYLSGAVGSTARDYVVDRRTAMFDSETGSLVRAGLSSDPNKRENFYVTLKQTVPQADCDRLRDEIASGKVTTFGDMAQSLKLTDA